MRNRRLARAAWVLGAILLAAGPARAVVLGQVDDFEDGTTQNWDDGGGLNPNPPSNVSTGGPAGAGDAYLRIQGRGGLGAGSKPTAINRVQWIGNYSAAGVIRISADLRNAGATQLDMRLLFTRDFVAGGQRFVTAPVIVPAGSGWVRATWQVSAADLIPIDALPGDPAVALQQIGELRIFHNPAAGFPGPSIVADLGVDNIRAEDAADRDGDGQPDDVDNCPFFANADQLDSNDNGRGDLCECGDQNGDGKVDVSDLVAINVAIFNPAQATPLCDATGDGLCNVEDIVAANREIFSPGSTSTCERQPEPGP